MEELLPLIIGILWVVYTLYNKGQKKKRPVAANPVEENENRKPSILEQLLMGEEAVESQPYVNTETDTQSDDFEREVVVDEVVKEHETPFLKRELSNFIHEGESVFQDEDEIKDASQMETQKETFEFDLRKAILYSEILNAPYIGYK